MASVPDAVGHRLALFAELLARWQSTINLVAPSTLPGLWRRHIADSLQVQALVPRARRWVDLGSGGGFPGLVTAIVLADDADAEVHLVESDKRKAAFLRTVSRETGVRAIVHAERIERFVATHLAASPIVPVDAVSARALAPLRELLDHTAPLLRAGAIGVFPKGQQAEAELTDVPGIHRFTFDFVPSRTDPLASVVLVRAADGPKPTGV